MKLSVLEIVQLVLSKMNSDSVNSISDTVESYQVALEVQATYFDMISNIEASDRYELLSLTASGTTARPTHMTVPDAIDHFKWIRYNHGSASAPDYKSVEYKEPEEFIEHISSAGSSNIVVQDLSGAYFNISNDAHPSYFTLFNNDTVVFDSYLATVDSTLQESKTLAWGLKIPTFSLTDAHVPDLPQRNFPQLIAETSAACHAYFKQMPSMVDERRARKQLVRGQNNSHRRKANALSTYNFGRSPSGR